MAKRRAEDPLLHDSPSKRCYRSLCSVDMQLGSMAPTSGGVSPPSLLALLGSRSRKRPYYFVDMEEQEEEKAAAVYRKGSHCCDIRKHAASVLTVQTSGSFQDRRSSSALTGSKKRPREDCTASETVIPKDNDKVDNRSRPFIVKLHHYQNKELILRLARERGPLTYDGSRIHIFPDFSPDISKRRAAFSEVKQKLHAAKIKFGLYYPATLQFIHNKKRIKFTDPGEALAYINNKIADDQSSSPHPTIEEDM